MARHEGQLLMRDRTSDKTFPDSGRNIFKRYSKSIEVVFMAFFLEIQKSTRSELLFESWIKIISAAMEPILTFSLPLSTAAPSVSLCCTHIYSVQAVCEEIRRLAPEAGLHHDGVVFGSDDFCASIGSYYTVCFTIHSFLATHASLSLSLSLSYCYGFAALGCIAM